MWIIRLKDIEFSSIIVLKSTRAKRWMRQALCIVDIYIGNEPVTRSSVYNGACFYLNSTVCIGE